MLDQLLNHFVVRPFEQVVISIAETCDGQMDESRLFVFNNLLDWRVQAFNSLVVYKFTIIRPATYLACYIT